MKNIDKSFLGIGWSFPPTFQRAWYGVEMLTEEEDVQSSIHIIVSTVTGERVLLPTFGCNLQPYLFESINASNIALIEKIVREALVFHEPRIVVEGIVTTPEMESGRLMINVQYSIITTNTRYNYVFPFYIHEATNIERA
jgi:uncharacterized protein